MLSLCILGPLFTGLQQRDDERCLLKEATFHKCKIDLQPKLLQDHKNAESYIASFGWLHVVSPLNDA